LPGAEGEFPEHAASAASAFVERDIQRSVTKVEQDVNTIEVALSVEMLNRMSMIRERADDEGIVSHGDSFHNDLSRPGRFIQLDRALRDADYDFQFRLKFC
jgi:hypothetical protein